MFLEHMLCAKQCSKDFTCLSSFIEESTLVCLTRSHKCKCCGTTAVGARGLW